MLRTSIAIAVALLAVVSSARAAEPTFTKDEAQAAFTMGELTQAAQQAQDAATRFAATPAARSALEKMKPAPTPPASKPRSDKP